jgi:hypothetical protein
MLARTLLILGNFRRTRSRYPLTGNLEVVSGSPTTREFMLSAMVTPQAGAYTVPMLNPPNTILEVSMMYAVSRCLHVIAEMGVADALGDDPRTAADLAETTGANSDALARALRVVSAYGIFERRNDGCRAHEFHPHASFGVASDGSSAVYAVLCPHAR